MSGSEAGSPAPAGADLAATAGFALLAVVSLLPPLQSSPVRPLSGALLVLVLPGYALLAAVFPAGRPAGGRSTRPGTPGVDPAGPSVAGRLGLAAGLSLPCTLAVGLAAAAVGHLSGAVLTLALAATTLALCGVAATRRSGRNGVRWRGPFGVPGSVAAPSVDRIRALVGGRSRRETALDVALVGTLLLAVGVAAALLAIPTPAGGHSELYLLGADTGGPDVGGYPTNLTAGQRGSVVVGVENHHGGDRRYAVVVVLQRVSTVAPAGNATAEGNLLAPADGASGPVTVLAERRLGAYRRTVAAGGRWTLRQSFAPDRPGRYRLVVGLYPGGTGGDPRHRVHLWVNVTASNDGGGDP